MFEYYLEKILMGWFDNPKRPKPPIYSRPLFSRVIPTYQSPAGEIRPYSETVRLTDEQVKIWSNT